MWFCRGYRLQSCWVLCLFAFVGTAVFSLPDEDGTTTTTEKIKTKEEDDDLSAPLEVRVDKTTSSSIQLSWRPPPPPKEKNLKLYTYSLVLTPITRYGHGPEKEYSLAPSVTSKLVAGMTENTKYAVQLSAVFADPSRRISHDRLVRVAAPKFVVFVPPDAQQDIPVGDDGLPENEPPCNCSEPGMVACTRRPEFVECACRAGYAGAWCEECAPGNFRAGKECVVCPCSNLTSTAHCRMDKSGRVSCAQCLPGHRGSLCSSCAAGYQWAEDRCTPLNCLSNTLCAEQRGAPGCEDCLFLEDKFPSSAHRSNADRSVADGTLPLVALMLTLGFLLLVAAMATCWRYWDYRRQKADVPFWSIELQADEKAELHRAHCQYQHLDAATNRAIGPGAPSPPPLPMIVEDGEDGPLNVTDSIRRTYSAIDV